MKKTHLLLSALLISLTFFACGNDDSNDIEGTDTHQDSDTTWDSYEGDDSETSTNPSDTESSSDAEDLKTWTDSTTNLMWQFTSPETMKWSGVAAYCSGLSLDGHDDWRVPSINELRSIIRGCPDTEMGGACSVTDDCLDTWQCWDDEICWGCSSQSGPGEDGCYWPNDFKGWCGHDLWSSNTAEDDPSYAWFVNFQVGRVNSGDKNNDGTTVRCVREITK